MTQKERERLTALLQRWRLDDPGFSIGDPYGSGHEDGVGACASDLERILATFTEDEVRIGEPTKNCPHCGFPNLLERTACVECGEPFKEKP